MNREEIYRLLESDEAFVIVWTVEDVRSVRPDLTEEQCFEVLDACDNRHDANIGMNWDVIRMHAEDLFPEP
jgi:hypothetical protein